MVLGKLVSRQSCVSAQQESSFIDIFVICAVESFPLPHFLIFCVLSKTEWNTLSVCLHCKCVLGVSLRTPPRYNSFQAVLWGREKKGNEKKRFFFSKKDFVAFGTANNLCGKIMFSCVFNPVPEQLLVQ